METAATVLGVVLFLAFFVQSTVEYVFGTWLDKNNIRYVALAAGVLAAVAFNVDLLAAYFNLDSIIPYAGHVATGIIIGQGSSYVNDLAKRYILNQPNPDGG